MAQFVECLRGMGDACRALDFPIVSGNVSLYNESKATGGGSAILPTPAIGGVGLLDDWEKAATIGFKAEKQPIILVGVSPESSRTARREDRWYARWGSELGQSLWLRETRGRADGSPPFVDLALERNVGEFVRDLIDKRLVTAVHDISDGGIAVALAEMALAGNVGAEVQSYGPELFDYFCEDQGRYVLTMTAKSEEQYRAQLSSRARELGFEFEGIGITGGERLRLLGEQEQVEADIPLTDLRAAYEGFFPKLMGGELAPAA